MSASLEIGNPFPDFVLGEFDSRAERKGKPILAIVWRTGCSTCRFAMPFYDRIYRAYPDAVIVGISQDSQTETAEYCAEKDIWMPQALDMHLTVSRMYGTTVVPTYVLADAQGIIRLSGMAWSRELAEDISRMLAEWTGTACKQVVFESDSVPNFKPG